jgi:hypothetical protein
LAVRSFQKWPGDWAKGSENLSAPVRAGQNDEDEHIESKGHEESKKKLESKS